MRKRGGEPVRMCVVCGRRFPKRELLRYAGAAAGGMERIPDPEQILPGRGVYVCGDARCGERFRTWRAKRKKR